jgi:type I restriction enzyme R subunit
VVHPAVDDHEVRMCTRLTGKGSGFHPYSNAAWEKLPIFLNFLTPKLPAPIDADLAKGILETIDMDSYRAEKLTTRALHLPDQNGEIGPVPTAGGGNKPEP